MRKLFYASANFEEHRRRLVNLAFGELSVTSEYEDFFEVEPIESAGNKKHLSVLEFGIPQRFPDGRTIVYHESLDGALDGIRTVATYIRDDDYRRVAEALKEMEGFFQ